MPQKVKLGYSPHWRGFPSQIFSINIFFLENHSKLIQKKQFFMKREKIISFSLSFLRDKESDTY